MIGSPPRSSAMCGCRSTIFFESPSARSAVTIASIRPTASWSSASSRRSPLIQSRNGELVGVPAALTRPDERYQGDGPAREGERLVRLAVLIEQPRGPGQT
jgi:hypothetical protein